jgi:phosphate transport system protein
MHKYFDEEVGSLKEKLLFMGSYAESAVSEAVQALTERNDKLALLVQANDDIMDQYEIEIDNLAIQLLSKSPPAQDLRLITVAMKISQNLERIGDEATTIARRAVELNQDGRLKVHLDIRHMAAVALGMLKESLDAFVNEQPEKARAIIPQDKEVDTINRQFYKELSTHMGENPSTISRCLNLMTVSKSLERVADHATNIAQEVVYLCEARDIRHEAHKP